MECRRCPTSRPSAMHEASDAVFELATRRVSLLAALATGPTKFRGAKFRTDLAAGAMLADSPPARDRPFVLVAPRPWDRRMRAGWEARLAL